MNSPNIPPVNKANRPLVSVGNGNQVKWGDFPTSQTTSTSSSSGNATSLNTTAYPVTAAPTISGQILSWDGSAWVAGSSSGNSAWPNTTLVTSTLPVTSAGKIVTVTGVTGFSTYLVEFDISAVNGDTTTGRNLFAYVYQDTTAKAQMRNYMVSGQVGSTHVTYIATGLTSTTSYAFSGYAFQGGTTTGTVVFASINVVGIS